ncbi:MFS transporter, partial [Balneolaceae bacterium ANBcel3]|nr:MFS transporter [Balneolaceae bacterium ANBcel3]
MSSPATKLSFKEKVSYGFGDLASVLYWQTFMLYFTYFYTDVFIIPAAVAATMFLVTRLFDGINDPVMGMIADRTNTRWGKFRPYLLWLCVPFAISGVLVFTTPDLGYTGKLIWAYATFIFVMVMYTAINIPYTALMGVISPNSEDRTTVSSFKFIFAFAAGIIISATLLPSTKWLGKDDDSIVSAQLQNDTIVVQEGKTGASTFIITAFDEEGHQRRHELRFTTAHAEKNIIEPVNPVPDITLNQGFGSYSVALDGVFSGSAHDDFSFRASSSDAGLVQTSIENDVLVLSEGSANGSGTAFIRLYAVDDRWGEQALEFAVDVMEPGNQAPVLTDSTDVRFLDSGFLVKTVDLQELFEDPDGDTLEFLAFSSNMELLEPIITNSMMEIAELGDGIAEISVIAMDGRGGRAEHTIRYIVRDPAGGNAPMVTRPDAGFEIAAGFGTYTIPLSDYFMDVDGQRITFDMYVVNEAKGWSRFFMIVGVFAVLFFLIAFLGTKERVQPPKTQKTSVRNDIKELVTNAPWLILLAVTITFILFVAVRSSVTVHYFKYIIGHQAITLPFFGEGTYDFTALASAYNTIGQISSLLGVIVVLWISKILG